MTAVLRTDICANYSRIAMTDYWKVMAAVRVP
jgi:hypothetical protein